MNVRMKFDATLPADYDHAERDIVVEFDAEDCACQYNCLCVPMIEIIEVRRKDTGEVLNLPQDILEDFERQIREYG